MQERFQVVVVDLPVALAQRSEANISSWTLSWIVVQVSKGLLKGSAFAAYM